MVTGNAHNMPVTMATMLSYWSYSAALKICTFPEKLQVSCKCPATYLQRIVQCFLYTVSFTIPEEVQDMCKIHKESLQEILYYPENIGNLDIFPVYYTIMYIVFMNIHVNIILLIL